MDLEGLQDKCGVFGCVASKIVPDLEVANIISTGLIALQHRGQESAGMSISRGKGQLNTYRGMGLVDQVFSAEILEKLDGILGIGHTRYSTVGGCDKLNCQPFVVESTYGQFAVAHNGELVNSKSLKSKLLLRGIGLSSGTDSESMTQLLCETPDCGEPLQVNWLARIKRMMDQTQLSYSLAILSQDKIYVVRDPYGNRPLSLGVLHSFANRPRLTITDIQRNALGYVVSSESCAFSSMGATFLRDVLPGEIVQIDPDGIKSLGIVQRKIPNSKPALCIFEYIYFCRPDSYLEGQQINAVRYRLGQQLAKESYIEADLVSGIPESATASALGFSKESGIPYVEIFTRNRYVGRTFIQPSKHLRKLGVVRKFGCLKENFVDKKIIIIDDSIVRGNTLSNLINLLRQFGAAEVHVRISSPPIKHPCFMGINIPTESELIYNSVRDADQLSDLLGADSLRYLSVDGLHEVVRGGIIQQSLMAGNFSDSGNHGYVPSEEDTVKTANHNDINNDNYCSNEIGHCDACLTGNYPIAPEF